MRRCQDHSAFWVEDVQNDDKDITTNPKQIDQRKKIEDEGQKN